MGRRSSRAFPEAEDVFFLRNAVSDRLPGRPSRRPAQSATKPYPCERNGKEVALVAARDSVGMIETPDDQGPAAIETVV